MNEVNLERLEKAQSEDTIVEELFQRYLEIGSQALKDAIL
jgi:hypothetical protein